MTSQFSAEVPHRLDMILNVDLDVKPQIKRTYTHWRLAIILEAK